MPVDRAQRRRAGAERADAGQDDAVGLRDDVGIGGDRDDRVAPAAFSALSTECRLPAP